MKLSPSNVTFIGSVPTIAAIDVGSNAIRLAIANANTEGGYQTVYSVRESVRLGQDVFTKGTISGHTIDRTVQTFIDFKQKIEEHGATHVKAVGTSALREATNRDGVLKSIFKATGIGHKCHVRAFTTMPISHGPRGASVRKDRVPQRIINFH